MSAHGQQSGGATELDELACKLVSSGDYRVLRRLTPREPMAAAGHTGRTGIVLDVETTRLDVTREEIIELAMFRFRYRPNGEITGVSAIFQGLSITDDLHRLSDAPRVITPELPKGFAVAPIVDNWALRQGTRLRWFLCAIRRSIKVAGQLRLRLKRA